MRGFNLLKFGFYVYGIGLLIMERFFNDSLAHAVPDDTLSLQISVKGNYLAGAMLIIWKN